MAGAQCREVGREGGAADFAELCIAGVREGAARTAGGREGAAAAARKGAMPMGRRLLVALMQGREKEGGLPAESIRLGGLYT